jgi:3-(3-hydroxy-phenyl)propionate hydroxylase
MEESDPRLRAANLDELRQIAENPQTARGYMRRAALLDSLNSENALR